MLSLYCDWLYLVCPIKCRTSIRASRDRVNLVPHFFFILINREDFPLIVWSSWYLRKSTFFIFIYTLWRGMRRFNQGNYCWLQGQVLELMTNRRPNNFLDWIVQLPNKEHLLFGVNLTYLTIHLLQNKMNLTRYSYNRPTQA